MIRSTGDRGRSARLRVLSAAVTILTAVTAGALTLATPAVAAPYPAECPAGGGAPYKWRWEIVHGVAAFTTGHMSFTNTDICQVGKTRLIMENGDLYVIDERGTIRWRASWENNQVQGNGAYMYMQLDGNFVMYDWNDRALWASNTYTGREGRLAVQADGNVVVYTPGWVPRWSSRSAH